MGKKLINIVISLNFEKPVYYKIDIKYEISSNTAYLYITRHKDKNGHGLRVLQAS